MTKKLTRNQKHTMIQVSREDHAAIVELRDEILARGTNALGPVAVHMKSGTKLGLGSIAGVCARFVLRELQAGPSKWRAT